MQLLHMKLPLNSITSR